MKIVLAGVLASAACSFTLPALAKSGFVPKYSSTAYCRKIGNVAGGSYEIEETCRNEESEASSSIASKNIPDRVWIYCDKIGKIAGGSFQIFNTCVDQELASARRLR